jgi:hypothetical protein
MTHILAIDPGTAQSAAVCFADDKPGFTIIEENRSLLERMRGWDHDDTILVIEMVCSYGMSVGAEVFQTVLWIGRFWEAWESRGGKVAPLFRRDVKMHLCHNNAAKDANIRQALLDRFGPGKALAIGVKALPGPLYGIKKDLWSALALAVTYADREKGALHEGL